MLLGLAGLRTKGKTGHGKRRADQKCSAIRRHKFVALILFERGADTKGVTVRMTQVEFPDVPRFVGWGHRHVEAMFDGEFMCRIDGCR